MNYYLVDELLFKTVTNYLLISMKVALCFLISGKHEINKESLWKDWIEENKDIINVYFHYTDYIRILYHNNLYKNRSMVLVDFDVRKTHT